MYKAPCIMAALLTSLLVNTDFSFAAESHSGKPSAAGASAAKAVSSKPGVSNSRAGASSTAKSNLNVANSKLHMLEFYLPGAGCGGCRLRLERLLRQVSGAKRARVTGSRAKAIIYYDSSLVKSQAFLELMKKEGYATEEITDQAIASLPEEQALPRGVELKGLDDLKPVF